MQTAEAALLREKSATCSTRSKNVCSAHWMSSKTTDERRRAPRAACGTPRRSRRPKSGTSRSPSSERTRSRRARHGQRAELLDHLDDRQVRDPLPVGEAVTPNDARRRLGDELLDKARLADPRLAHDRHELAPPLSDGALPGVASSASSSLGRRSDRMRPLRSPAHPTAGSGAPARTCPSARAARAPRHPTASRGKSERRLPDQDLAGCRRLLQPRRHVDRVAGDERPGPGHNLARIDADPACNPQLRERVPHLHRREAPAKRRPRVRPAPRRRRRPHRR